MHTIRLNIRRSAIAVLTGLFMLFGHVAWSQCSYTQFTLSPNTNICGSSTDVTLSGSESSAIYQLNINGSNYGGGIQGTGGPLDFGNVPSDHGGTFLVYATKPFCSAQVVGHAQIFFSSASPSGGSVSTSGSICSGSSATLTFNPPDGQTYTYQWKLNGSAISGATSVSYTASVAGTYSVAVSNACGSENVNGPTLSGVATGAPGPVTGPTNNQLPLTSSTYTVTASSNATSYTWSLSDPAAGTVSGSGTTAVVAWASGYAGPLTVNAAAVGGCGTVSGTGLSVTVYAPVLPGTIGPATQTIAWNTAPDTLRCTSPEGGNGSYAYQWQKSADHVNWINIQGAWDAAYEPGVLTQTTYFRRFTVSNNSSTATSAAEVIVTGQPVAPVVTPSAQLIYTGGTATHLVGTAATGGDNSFTYHWQIGDGGSPTEVFTDIPGETALEFNPSSPSFPLTQNTHFRLKAVDGSLTLFSNVATVNVTDCLPLNTMESANMNYVEVSEPRIPGIRSVSDFRDTLGHTTRTVCELMQTIQYVDGLGRPLQTVEVTGSASENDMIHTFVYDQFGRESMKYLPYSDNTPTPGAFQANALTSSKGYTGSKQYQFYQSGTDHVFTHNPYDTTIYEPSPLSRVIEQGAPGASWQPLNNLITGSGHTMRTDYSSNDQNVFSTTTLTNNPGSHMVALYAVTINTDQSRVLTRASNSATYNTGQLSLTITKDENWKPSTDGCLSTIEEYKDKQGNIVLKRTYNKVGGALEMLSTYYVYDDLGQLSFVLPAAVNADAMVSISQATLNNLCYQYRYDERGRLTQKKLPGKGWEYIVYNYADQPVATQDSMRRAANQWVYSKYDGTGRVIMTGIYNVGSTRAALQDSLSAITTNLWETPVNSGTGYTSVAWPKDSTTPLTINYYDRYDLIPSLPTAYRAPSSAFIRPTGLLTATKTAVLNTPTDMLWSVDYYDDLGHTIKRYAQHYLGGVLDTANYDAITSTYNFTNQPTSAARQHFTTGHAAPVLTINNQYLYDHKGRKLKTWQQVQNGTKQPDARTLLSDIDYNEVGQTLTKALHSADSVNFLQYVGYVYNERGWLTNSNSLLFSEELHYNTGANPQYNGNINSQLWGSMFNLNNRFNYIYDRLNRLISGATTNGKYIERGISYDKAGNISSLSRVYNSTVIDSLSLAYNSTNQLQSVWDRSSNAGTVGYKPGKWGYTYDGNGNMITDSSKAISTNYNLLNLPQNIAALNTTYTYDANGRKLRRVVGTYVTDYIDGVQYEGLAGAESIRFIQTEEGRVLPVDTVSYNYEYNLTDHLGNNRITFDTYTHVYRKMQQDDYMPFGMDISTSPVNSPQNFYLYNNKELQSNTQLYDYGARHYDPVIGRWNVVDPKSEKYYGLSPYQYANNMPINLVDPNGQDVDPSNLTDDKNKRGLVKFFKTEEGKAFIANYLKKGQSFSIAVDGKKYVFVNGGSQDGKFSNDRLQFLSVQNLGQAAGLTRIQTKTDNNQAVNGQTNQFMEPLPAYDVRKGIDVQIALSVQLDESASAAAIGHEAFVHALPSQLRTEQLKEELNDGTITPGSKLYSRKLDLIYNNSTFDHNQLINNKVPHYINLINQLNILDHTSRYTQIYKDDIEATTAYERPN